jgi:hypothetical protein
MPSNEIVSARMQVESQEDPSAPAQHHDEGHQWSFGTTYLQVIKMSPLCQVSNYAELIARSTTAVVGSTDHSA